MALLRRHSREVNGSWWLVGPTGNGPTCLQPARTQVILDSMHRFLDLQRSKFKSRAQMVGDGHGRLIYLPGPWWDVIFMMLIGMALIKMGVLSGERSYAFYAWITTICFGIGLSCAFVSAWIPFKGGFTPEALWLGFVFYQPGRLAGLGYCAILIMMVKAGVLRRLTSRLAAVGQTAFTNYILTTVICTTIFEDYGFGL
jgi:uncharacterized membrane protein YeiB